VKFNKGDINIKIGVWNERLESVGDVYQPYWAPKRITGYNWVIKNGESYIEGFKRLEVQFTTQKVKVDIDDNTFNNIKVVAGDNKIECYLNGKMVNTYTVEPFPVVTSVAAVDDKTNEVIIKIINISGKDDTVKIKLDQNVNSTAKGLILTSDDKNDTNSFENKTKVSPKQFIIDNISSEFEYNAPKYSLSVIRVGLSQEPV